MTGILDHDWFPGVVPDGVECGEGTWLYSAYAFLHCVSRQAHPLRVGKRSGIYAGTCLVLGPEGEVDIGDFCTVVGAIININGRLTIGDYCFFANDVTIADSSWPVPWARDAISAAAPSTTIGSNVWVGTRATILSGISIGEGAVVGAAAVVESSVPPFGIVAGTPARVVGDTRTRRSRA
jgi:acetyltransferase-like isoleucine patch superfamily enzyme